MKENISGRSEGSGASSPDLDAVRKLTKDLKAATITLTDREARYLVDSYYAIQDYRIQAAAQSREASKAGEPHAVLQWLGENMETLEGQIKRALQAYAESRRPGRWALSVYGVGPVIAAGLLAHITMTPWRCAKPEDKEKCREGAPHTPLCGPTIAATAGHLWRFAGLDPTVTWEKGQKRPWNAKLKVLCWKIGQSFMKFSNRDDCFYGKIYRDRKLLEVTRNSEGLFADQAKAKLEKFKIKDKATLETYEGGKLPDGRLELRAERYAVKIFLSHFHHVMFEDKFGEKPPKPFAIAQLGHAHYIEVPGWPCE